ncbi:MAG TPA: type II toxin-antitoxin system Phd/YefM family antitoxin [Gemmatimonadaceae bacterium]|jgi:prevent-host-death family protein|nr:type II toxin-antitoxin system Phd/YefM family antitoxin [Gemmatimonadaceae bacterium]
MPRDTWTAAEAKAHFSEVLDQVQSDGPQTITRKGRVMAVVVSFEEWQRKTQRTGTLAEFFSESPLRNAKITVTRLPDAPRS